jgi:hypothetical protein
MTGKVGIVLTSVIAIAVTATIATTLGIDPGIASATPSQSSPDGTKLVGCLPGYRALTFTNDCSFDVYLGENLSSPQLQGTPACTTDAQCNPSDNLYCVGGTCNQTCTTDSNCGANQVCYPTNKKNASGSVVSLCYFKNFEPTSTSSPSSGSAWQLPANGGQSAICIPEGPTSAPGPTGGTGIAGASCTKNSDCISNTCAGGAAHNQFCTAGESGCQCLAVFTWGGNFWGRTDCTGANTGTNSLTCQTGNCGAANGAAGNLDCNSTPTATGPFGQQVPAFVGEFTLEVPPNGSYNAGAQDFYDNSYVSGFNVGYSMVPVAGTYSPAYTSSNPKQCGPAGAVTVDSTGNPTTYCPFDLLGNCPAELRYPATGAVEGCWAPTQACLNATPAQQAALGCTGQVPFLCQKNSDCPYNAAGTAQTMTCNIGAGQAFGQCQCATSNDCPSGFTCSGTPGTCQKASGATWADLYGCANFYNLSPYNGMTTSMKDTGIVCGCPSWTAPPEVCLADNINWEQVPVGSTSAVASPAPTTSAGDYFTIFHNQCPTAYTYPYDDAAATFGCTNTGGTTGPSYNMTFCPAAASPTTTPTGTATATATATSTSSASATPTSTATPTATTSITPTATASPTVGPTPSPTTTPTAIPTPGGNATLITQGTGTYGPGDQVILGTFGYAASDPNAQQVESVTITVGDPRIFSSLTLTASIDGVQVGSATVTSPDIESSTLFTFTPPVAVPTGPGTSLTFALYGVISGNKSGRIDLSSQVKLAGIIGGGRADGFGGAGRLMLALTLLGFVMAPLTGTRQRRRSAVIAVTILMLATSLLGCGGSSGAGSTTTASGQHVFAMAVTEGGSQVSVAGLPLDLGKISKK